MMEENKEVEELADIIENILPNTHGIYVKKCMAEGILNAGYTRTSSTLMPLDKASIYELLDKYKFSQGYIEFVNELCEKFGTPKAEVKYPEYTNINQFMADEECEMAFADGRNNAIDEMKKINGDG